MTYSLLIAGHGSRDPEGIAEFLQLARHIRQDYPLQPVEIAFLEFARPTIQEGFDRLVRDGSKRIVMVPGVLMAAGHAKNDMASEVRLARERHPDVEIHMGRSLDVDARLLQLCRHRYHEALADYPPLDPAQTLLLLVGRGSSDPDANSNIAKVTRFLQEGYPTAWGAWAYSGVAQPLVDDALTVCERTGFRHIVIQPYFLFTGILLKRIYAQVEKHRRARPDLDFLLVSHLRAHPLLVQSLLERAREALDGEGNMNCSLCQYRVPIIGYENAVGEPQQAHHHHVEGLSPHTQELAVVASSVAVEHRYQPLEVTAEWEESQDPHPWRPELLEQLLF